MIDILRDLICTKAFIDIDDLHSPFYLTIIYQSVQQFFPKRKRIFVRYESRSATLAWHDSINISNLLHNNNYRSDNSTFACDKFPNHFTPIRSLQCIVIYQLLFTYSYLQTYIMRNGTPSPVFCTFAPVIRVATLPQSISKRSHLIPPWAVLWTLTNFQLGIINRPMPFIPSSVIYDSFEIRKSISLRILMRFL